MPPGPEPDELARRIVNDADRLFPVEARPDFSEVGYAEFATTVASYISDFLNETYRETRRQHADRVTPAYVREAAKRLTTSRRRVGITFLGSLGGIILGAGVASIPGWIGSKAIDSGQALFVLLMAAVGGSMLVGAFVTELLGR